MAAIHWIAKLSSVATKMLLTSALCFHLYMSQAETSFNLPQQNSIRLLHRVECRAVGYTGLSVDNNRLQAETSPGADHLILRKVGRMLNVVINGKEATIKSSPDIYQIVYESKFALSAIQGGEGYDAVHTIVLNKTSGLAVWSESVPALVDLGHPFASQTYLSCTDEDYNSTYIDH